MEQICEQGGHFLLMVKKNQPLSYEEIVKQFEELEKDRERPMTEMMDLFSDDGELLERYVFNGIESFY